MRQFHIQHGREIDEFECCETQENSNAKKGFMKSQHGFEIKVMRNIRKFNQILGFYMPSMFHLHVHTESNITNWKAWDDETQCTFLHEYIHFLQDISTVMGLYNIYVLGECLADVVNQVYQMNDSEITVPIQLIPSTNNVYNNSIVNTVVAGSFNLPDGVDEDNLMITGKANVIPNIQNMNGKNIDLSMIHVPYQGGGNFLLGNYHISESMAYIGEKIMYGGRPSVIQPSPNYPYDVVRQLAQFYSPKLSNNLPLLFSLCDLSLTFSHAGKILIHFFDQYIKDGCPTDWRAYIVDVISRTNASAVNGVGSYSKALNEIKDLAIESLDKRFKGVNYDDIRRWYYNIINRIVTCRLNNPLFLVDFIQAGELKKNPVFEQLLKNIGTPVLTNDYHHTYFTDKVHGCHLKKRRAQFLQAAGSITYALLDAEFPCDLRYQCKAEGRCIDRDCVRAPWKHARRINPCPYGHLWYGWKLRKKSLKS